MAKQEQKAPSANAPAKMTFAKRAEMKHALERKRIAEKNKAPFVPGVADAPFGHCGRLYQHQMRDTLFSLIPVVATTAFLWGPKILFMPGIAAAAALVCEAAISLVLRRPLRITNLNSVVIGCLLALLLPAGTPWWVLAFGAASAVILGKMLLIREGRPILNPVLVGWLAIALLWPIYLQATQSPPGAAYVDPLRLLREGGVAAISGIDLSVMFKGQYLGGLGAVDVRDLMLGGMYMLYRRNIDWRILVSFFVGGIILAAATQMINPEAYAGAAFHIYTGSFFFGAIFLIGDFGSAPILPRPAMLYGFTAGALVIIFRIWGPFPDAVPPAILAVNALVYAISRIKALPDPKARAVES